MKLTKIRVNDKLPQAYDLQLIESKLSLALYQAGFITDVTIVNKTSIKIGMHMRCFVINTDKLGYNAQIDVCNAYGNLIRTSGLKGYKRTNTPTWDQRVEFNDIINMVLNELNVSCNIKSGIYTIRQGIEVFSEQDWENQTPMHSYSYAVERIVKLTNEMVKEGKDKLKAHKLANKVTKLEKLVTSGL